MITQKIPEDNVYIPCYPVHVDDRFTKGAIQVLHNAMGGGVGVSVFPGKKALQRCRVQRY